MESAERKNDWPRIINLTKIPLSDVGKIKAFSDELKLRKFITIRLHYK